MQSLSPESAPDAVQQIWLKCVGYLQDELPAQQFNTWILPLRPRGVALDGGITLELSAPNRFIRDWVADKFLSRIVELSRVLSDGVVVTVEICESQLAATTSNAGFIDRTVGAQAVSARHLSDVALADSSEAASAQTGVIDTTYLGAPSGHANSFPGTEDRRRRQSPQVEVVKPSSNQQRNSHQNSASTRPVVASPEHQNNLIAGYRFDNFVEGKSNQLARAAAMQVVENPGGSYNPLFLYGGVGLGKTHLMHAVGNELQAIKPGAKVIYLHSERFVADMVKALQLNAINDFKRYYRGVDALLIDDIQFFANKERSQEEFFHTFNALLEGGQQMILTSDRYPKEIRGVEERLKSRFGWGLTVSIEPPELETRVAILMKKAEQTKMELPHEAAFFLAQRVRSNVRELEGALKRVIASAHFMKCPIDVPLIKESLKDLLALQDKQVSIDNIQRTTAEYYKMKVADLMSKRRNRSVARPRQVAMALAKELTNHSLPEIGDAFGGRDHTTVLHACRKIKELKETNSDIREDYKNLVRTLAT